MEMFRFLLFLVVLSVVQSLHKDSIGITPPVKQGALLVEQGQLEPVSLPYPGVLGPVDPNSAAKNAVEVTNGFKKLKSLTLPIGPVGPQRQTDIFSNPFIPQVEAIESARGWLPPVDPYSAARNVKRVAHGSDISSPINKEAIESAVWLPPVDPYSASRNVNRVAHGSDISSPINKEANESAVWLPPVDPYSAARNVNRVAHGSDISSENVKAEANSKHNADQKDESAFNGFMLIFLIVCFLPLALLWVNTLGLREDIYLMFMPITYVLLQIVEDLVSQSLVDQMHVAIFPLLVLKALAVVSLFGLWHLCCGRRYLQTVSLDMFYIAVIAVGPLYAGYQLLNHVLYSNATLAEHMVFTNFGPPLVFLSELLLIPRDQQPKQNCSINMSLCAIAVGAGVFCLEGARSKITWNMCGYAGVSMLYFASQRWYMSEKGGGPISLLVIINGCFLLLPAVILSFRVAPQWSSASHWRHNKFTLMMLILAVATYACKFYIAMLMLKTASATSLLVNANLANCGVVILGLWLFGKASGMNAACFYVGLSVLLASCLWYCYEASDIQMVQKNSNKNSPQNSPRSSENKPMGSPKEGEELPQRQESIDNRNHGLLSDN